MDDPNMNAAFLMEASMIPLDEWVAERLENCLRISDSKIDEADRMSWLEDACYFCAIQMALQENAEFKRSKNGSGVWES